MAQKPIDCSDAEWATWPDCTVEGCPNKCCLSLDSDRCYPHTMLGPDADPHLLTAPIPVPETEDAELAKIAEQALAKHEKTEEPKDEPVS